MERTESKSKFKKHTGNKCWSKRHILTSSVNSMFSDYYGDENKVKELNENVLVDVLNANGIGGYARKTGEMLKENFGVKYNAANYEKEQEESYVMN